MSLFGLLCDRTSVNAGDSLGVRMRKSCSVVVGIACVEVPHPRIEMYVEVANMQIASGQSCCDYMQKGLWYGHVLVFSSFITTVNSS